MTNTKDDIEQRKLQSEKNAIEFKEFYNSYNARLREINKQRIETILNESLKSTQSLVPYWELREKYRLYVNTRNESLKFLLDKGTEAIQIMIDKELESEGIDPKKAAKGKKK